MMVGITSLSSVGLPVNNDDTDSNKSGSSHSDFHNYQITSTSLMYHPPPFSKGKQLPKGIHLNTVELVDISNDNDNAQIRRLDRYMNGNNVGVVCPVGVVLACPVGVCSVG